MTQNVDDAQTGVEAYHTTEHVVNLLHTFKIKIILHFDIRSGWRIGDRKKRGNGEGGGEVQNVPAYVQHSSS